MSDIGQLICPELDASLRLPTPAFALSLRHYRSSSDAIDRLPFLLIRTLSSLLELFRPISGALFYILNASSQRN